MDYVKIQTQVMKMLDKQEGMIVYQKTDEAVYLALDGHVAYIIPQEKWFMDTEKFNREPMNTFKNMFKDAEADEGFITNEQKILNNGTTVRKFRTAKGNHAWYDEKMLKPFMKDATNYKMTDGISPLYLFNGEILMGLVLPVRVKEGE